MQHPTLTDEQLSAIREQLTRKKKELEQQLSSFAKKDPDLKGNWTAEYEDLGEEWDDNAQEVTEYDKNVSLEQSFEIHLLQVKDALGRIEEGTFGFCKEDGKPIDPKRLMVYPETTVCQHHAAS